MATKRVDYRVFDGKYCIYTVKNNVLEGFLVSMFELASGTGPSKISRKHCHKTNIYVCVCVCVFVCVYVCVHVYIYICVCVCV